MRTNRIVQFVTAGLLSVFSIRADTIATYPVGMVLENIAVAPGGDLFVTSADAGIIYQVSPGGTSHIFSQTPTGLEGLTFTGDGTLVAVGETSVYRFAANGTPSLVTAIPGAAFLNGVTLFSAGTVLVADDTASTLWKVNLSTGASSAWTSGGLLSIPPDAELAFSVNGVKLFNGAVYVSNTGAQTLLRIPILADGSAGTPEIVASDFQVDDFAFATDGSIFAATQSGFLIHLLPDGTRTEIPTGTFGDAAVAFGRTADDLHDLYVVNNGGVFLDLPDGPEEASVLRLTTNTTGVVPELQAVPEPSAFLLCSVGIGIVTVMLLRRRSHA